MTNDDHALAILRFFKWNQVKLNDEWWTNSEKLSLEIGLEYDTSLKNKYPEIDDTTAEKNDNTCQVCFCEFDDNDEGSRPEQLACGHQFDTNCWKGYLKSKV